MSDLPRSLLKSLDKIRSIPARLNLKNTVITVIKRTWTGERVGIGTYTDTTLNLTADGYTPGWTKLTSGEVFASNNLYQTGDYKLTITPKYATGGYNVSDFTIDEGATAQELYFKVIDTGFPASGAFMIKVDQDVTSNLTYKLILRRTAQQP